MQVAWQSWLPLALGKGRARDIVTSRIIGRLDEEAGGRISTDSPSRCHIKRAVCYAVGLAELELLSLDRFDNQLEPLSLRTAPHTLLRMALLVAWLCRATEATGLRP